MEYDAKGVLLKLMKDDPANKLCFDCDAPQPQWCSLSHGTFICLTCSGVHRSLGVHISYVRSLTMDKFNETQVKKMTLGGNANCRAFFQNSGKYSRAMPIAEVYNQHFAAQYRDKLAAEVEGKPWDPSQTPLPTETTSASTGGLRKPRAGIQRGASPASGRSASPSTPQEAANPFGGKAVVDTQFFNGLGQANAARPDNLRPSEGGKYSGFGSQGSFNPSSTTSSRAVPSLDDFRSDPVSAFTKGWSVFASTVGQASAQINESVIQPGYARTQDPALQEQLSSYWQNASKTFGDVTKQGAAGLSNVMHTGSERAKRDFGVDVGDMGASYVDRIARGTAGQSYSTVGSASALDRQEAGQEGDDFFDSHNTGFGGSSTTYGSNANTAPAYGSNTNTGFRTYTDARAKPAPAPAKKEEEDLWADF